MFGPSSNIPWPDWISLHGKNQQASAFRFLEGFSRKCSSANPLCADISAGPKYPVTTQARHTSTFVSCRIALTSASASSRAPTLDDRTSSVRIRMSSRVQTNGLCNTVRWTPATIHTPRLRGRYSRDGGFVSPVARFRERSWHQAPRR